MEDVETRWRFVSAALALLLVGAVVGCVLLWRDRTDLEDLQDRVAAEAAATEEAERIVVAWLTYDYRSFDEDMRWVAESGTDRFQEERSEELLEGLRTKMVGPRRIVSRGRVLDSAASWEEDRVKVLVFTDQTLTDKEIRRQGRPALHARSGVELTMVHDDGEWLVDELVQLQFE